MLPALLKLIHDGQVSCTAADHFVSTAPLGLWGATPPQRGSTCTRKCSGGTRLRAGARAANVAEAAQRFRPAALAYLDFRRLPRPMPAARPTWRPLLRWSAKA